MLAGLETPTCGIAEIAAAADGRPANSMVFQGESIVPVDDGLRQRRLRPADAPRRRAASAARWSAHGWTGPASREFADAYPHQLSGGMKQRVALARAFANDPDVLLMDEPFSALDEQTKTVLQQELLRIWDETGKTVVFITHSVDEAVTLGDRILVMTAQAGPGEGHLRRAVRAPARRARAAQAPRVRRARLLDLGSLRDEVKAGAQ